MGPKRSACPHWSCPAESQDAVVCCGEFGWRVTFLWVRAVGSNTGSVLASLSSWEEELITHEDYDEEGPEVVQKLNILALS